MGSISIVAGHLQLEPCHSVAEQEMEKVQSWHFIGAARKVLSDAAPKPQLV